MPSAAETWVRLLLLGFSLLIIALPVDAADISWRRPEGGTFSSARNWFGGVVPGTGDNAIFGLSTSGPLGTLPPYTVSFTALASNDSLRIQDDSVVFDLNGLVYETINTSFGMVIGMVSDKTGQLTVTDGIVTLPFQSDLEIASIAGAAGALVVGAGGKVIGTMDVLVGLNGNGALLVNNNGDVIANDVTIGKNAGSTGTATMTGGGSSLLAAGLTVGGTGPGTLNVLSGGRVDSTEGMIGDVVGSTGAAIVSGANSLWQMSDQLRVGLSGEGTLRIEDGGTVRDKDSLVKGSAVVTGGSTWIHQFTLNVGMTSTSPGNLTIESGSYVQNGNCNLAISGAGRAFALVTDSGTTWVNTEALNVGSSGEGELTIKSGAAVTSIGGAIGLFSGSTGLARITGSTSTWTTSGDFVVGDAGDGQLEINSGKMLFTNESDLIVGDGVSGQLTISSGGQALDAFQTVVGNLAGGTGELTVTGPNSQLRTLDRLTVGSGGSGTLVISNGGRVTNDVAIISGVDSIVRVQGANSTWANRDILNLFNNAALVIEDGGAVSSVGSNISGSIAATSVITVSNGTWSNSSFLNVGSSGAGRLSIEAGGRIDSQTATIGVFSGSTGSVTVAGAGSTWTIDGDLRVGNDGVNNQGVGTLRIQPGGTVDVAGRTTLHVGDSMVLEGGTLSTVEIEFLQGHGTFQWNSGTFNFQDHPRTLQVPAGGVLDVGFGFGAATTTVHGGYNQSVGAVLKIESFGFGSTATGMDHLTVTDTAFVGGTLNLKLNSGTVINPALNYEIMSALSIAGSFANVANGQRLTTVDGFGSFVVNYGVGSAFATNKVVLSNFLVFTGLGGDYNNNGVVDAADYVVWRENNGTAATLPNDSTPGMVTAADYDVWRAHFGQAAGTASGSSTRAGELVPEPTVFAQLILVLAGCTLYIRWHAATKRDRCQYAP